MSIKIIAQAKLLVKVEKYEDGFISSCPSLKLYSQGKTLEKAKKNIESSIETFFTWCIKNETLDEALKQLGYNKITQRSLKKTPSKIPSGCEIFDLEVPLELLTQKNTRAYC